MKIGLDARFLTHPQMGGFKTYTTNLVTALMRVDSSNRYVLYLDRASQEIEAWFDLPNVQPCIVPGTTPAIGMPWREQVGLARQAARDHLDLLHAPCLTAPLRLPCPLVMTIHDMIWYFPERFSSAKPSGFQRQVMAWYYRTIPELMARRAAAVITVSQAAKASIVEHLALSPERVFVTHEAASACFHPLEDHEIQMRLRARLDIKSDFILTIGSADPRKNMATLIQAYARLPESLRSQYPLVIVWTHVLLSDQIRELTERLGLADCVHFLHGVSDAELVGLYNAARLFAFPSLYEGFGLPPLEAMACGTPVVAANNSSIPEIVGDAALLVDAQDAAGIAMAIEHVLTSPVLHAELAEKGKRRAGQFSWERCAAETTQVYQQVMSQPWPQSYALRHARTETHRS